MTTALKGAGDLEQSFPSPSTRAPAGARLGREWPTSWGPAPTSPGRSPRGAAARFRCSCPWYSWWRRGSAFSTGTSWGTFAIMLRDRSPFPRPPPWGCRWHPSWPLRFPAAFSATTLHRSATPPSFPSLAAGTDHIDHARTQLPYALLAGGVATAASRCSERRCSCPEPYILARHTGNFKDRQQLRRSSRASCSASEGRLLVPSTGISSNMPR